MAQRIEVGLELEGQDAIDFLEYLRNPTCTLRGMQIMREAYELAKSRERCRNTEMLDSSPDR
jgi:hypothetical protein